jgi:histidine transport system permease protein
LLDRWLVSLSDSPFDGYGAQLWQGVQTTLGLSLGALLLAFALGLASAALRLSRQPLAERLALAYTTVIRGVPDLVTMLILFYGVQLLLNRVTEALGFSQITIDPFAAGVLTLGFIYGAYFSETLRGAILAVPPGQLEAARAFGMTPFQVFRRILFPQMMRFALPGIGNNWQVLLKSSALVSIIGLNDVVRISHQAGKASGQVFFFMGLCALLYLAISSSSGLLLWLLQRHYATGMKAAQL